MTFKGPFQPKLFYDSMKHTPKELILHPLVSPAERVTATVDQGFHSTSRASRRLEGMLLFMFCLCWARDIMACVRLLCAGCFPQQLGAPLQLHHPWQCMFPCFSSSQTISDTHRGYSGGCFGFGPPVKLASSFLIPDSVPCKVTG